MRYTVVWRKSPLNTLMAHWSSSTNRAALTEAVERIDRLLGDDPDRHGEEYYGDRIVVVASIAVTFKIIEEDRIVEVIDLFSKEII
jgi:hypothetical protein